MSDYQKRIAALKQQRKLTAGNQSQMRASLEKFKQGLRAQQAAAAAGTAADVAGQEAVVERSKQEQEVSGIERGGDFMHLRVVYGSFGVSCEFVGMFHFAQAKLDGSQAKTWPSQEPVFHWKPSGTALSVLCTHWISWLHKAGLVPQVLDQPHTANAKHFGKCSDHHDFGSGLAPMPHALACATPGLWADGCPNTRYAAH